MAVFLKKLFPEPWFRKTLYVLIPLGAAAGLVLAVMVDRMFGVSWTYYAAVVLIGMAVPIVFCSLSFWFFRLIETLRGKAKRQT